MGYLLLPILTAPNCFQSTSSSGTFPTRLHPATSCFPTKSSTGTTTADVIKATALNYLIQRRVPSSYCTNSKVGNRAAIFYYVFSTSYLFSKYIFFRHLLVSGLKHVILLYNKSSSVTPTAKVTTATDLKSTYIKGGCQPYSIKPLC